MPALVRRSLLVTVLLTAVVGFGAPASADPLPPVVTYDDQQGVCIALSEFPPAAPVGLERQCSGPLPDQELPSVTNDGANLCVQVPSVADLTRSVKFCLPIGTAGLPQVTTTRPTACA